jgi:hypothetical protein
MYFPVAKWHTEDSGANGVWHSRLRFALDFFKNTIFIPYFVLKYLKFATLSKDLLNLFMLSSTEGNLVCGERARIPGTLIDE